ncbi:hypothetical protein EUTSA_v10012354mg [Eutrema salsugineum]|uniref:Auxin-responsive protein n=1 Tax=Eutrema salsugineum TaxID=72664 RepID=V4KS22_EUTSA|nr:hypothetical protein EUTSA_v10012354mg [Eutrema salsugineum]
MAKEGLGLEITELRLGLPGDNNCERLVCGSNSIVSLVDIVAAEVEDDIRPTAKSQVVGWPPVCSYRINKNNSKEVSKAKGYVKVRMDGVPYLRKIDLRVLALKECEKFEYVIIYEDKDGDWMLVGDVPWQMFKESCKRLRIVKRSDATGLGLQRDSSFV